MYLAPFLVPDVDHWCSKPQQPAFQNWTEMEWKEHAVPFTQNLGASERVFDGCNVHPYVVSAWNRSIAFDQTKMLPCRSWAYNETVQGMSAVPEVRVLFQKFPVFIEITECEM